MSLGQHDVPMALTDEHLRMKARVLWALKEHLGDELRYEVDPEHERDRWEVLDEQAIRELERQLCDALSTLMLQAHAEEAKRLEPWLV